MALLVEKNSGINQLFVRLAVQGLPFMETCLQMDQEFVLLHAQLDSSKET